MHVLLVFLLMFVSWGVILVDPNGEPINHVLPGPSGTRSREGLITS